VLGMTLCGPQGLRFHHRSQCSFVSTWTTTEPKSRLYITKGHTLIVLMVILTAPPLSLLPHPGIPFLPKSGYRSPCHRLASGRGPTLGRFFFRTFSSTIVPVRQLTSIGIFKWHPRSLLERHYLVVEGLHILPVMPLLISDPGVAHLMSNIKGILSLTSPPHSFE